MKRYQFFKEIEMIDKQAKSGLDLKRYTNFKILDDSYLNKFMLKMALLDDTIAFTISTNEIVIGIMICVRIDDLRKKSLMVKRTWMNESFRNNGIMTNLYRYIYHNLEYSILSDMQASPETTSIWNKLKSHFNVKMINTETGDISNVSDDIFDASKKFVYIIERYEIYEAV